jgi:restriction system protein
VIQAFAGALQGKQATKGIFITTSKFTPGAEEYVWSIPSRVILIDGRRLAELMIEDGVGVLIRDTYEVKEVDLSYFSTEGESASP